MDKFYLIDIARGLYKGIYHTTEYVIEHVSHKKYGWRISWGGNVLAKYNMACADFKTLKDCIKCLQDRTGIIDVVICKRRRNSLAKLLSEEVAK